METRNEETATVVADQFNEMERTVTDYGPGAVKVTKRIEGTAFFPGGIGLWRGLTSHGAAPRMFSTCPIMVLGHNFDKVSGLDASHSRGIESMKGNTWVACCVIWNWQM